MSEYYLTRSDELYHYGVKGQQWGNRQYQNADGSLTELGRQHYGYGPARQKMLDSRAKYKQAKKAYSKSAASKAEAEYKKAKQEYKNSDEHKARVKKAIKIGAAVAGTALAAYGAYKVSQVVRNKRALSSGQNLAATAKFQETLSKRYNDVIGNMNGRNSDTAKNYFNKNQSLKSALSKTQANLQAQNSANATTKMKSSLANAYNNVVGNMNGRDADKAKRYYDARKALTAPAERAAANSARVQKLRDTANNARNSASSAYNNARNAASSAYGNAKSAIRNNSTLQTLNATGKIAGQNARNTVRNASNTLTAKSDLKKASKLRSDINNIVSRVEYYRARSKAPGLDAQSRQTAKYELSKLRSELGPLENQYKALLAKRG